MFTIIYWKLRHAYLDIPWLIRSPPWSPQQEAVTSRAKAGMAMGWDHGLYFFTIEMFPPRHHRKSHKGLAGHILFSSFFNGDGFSITMIAMLDYMRWQEKLRTSEIGRVHKESWTITICRARCSRCGRKRWAQRSLFFENASASVQPWALRRTKMMVLFVPWMINLVHV